MQDDGERRTELLAEGIVRPLLRRGLDGDHGEQTPDVQEAVLQGVQARSEHGLDVDRAECSRVEPATVLERVDDVPGGRDPARGSPEPVEQGVQMRPADRAVDQRIRGGIERSRCRVDHAEQSTPRRRGRHGGRVDQVHGDAHTGADQGVDDADAGGDVVIGDAEDEHGGDRRLQRLITQAQHLSHQQGGGDRRAQAPPGQPHPGRQEGGDQHAGQHGADPHRTHLERGVRRRLDDEQRRQRAREVDGAVGDDQGDEVGDHRRGREPRDRPQRGEEPTGHVPPAIGSSRPGLRGRPLPPRRRG